jgi:F-type H+-transporting ATPase subunit epsilon
MQAHIVKVNGIFWSGEADAIIAPGKEGVLTVLPNHTPLVTALKPGRLAVKKGGVEVFTHEVKNGVLEVTSTSVTVLL